MPHDTGEHSVEPRVPVRARGANPTGRRGPLGPAKGPLILTPWASLKAPPLPLSPPAAAVDRLRRAFNAVRDAQEMLERLVRSGPVTMRPRLQAPIDDLEWTASALSTALHALQDPPPLG
jgi:hypothetical protein